MRRPLTIAVFLVLAALLGGSLAAGAATTNDTSCRKATIKGSVSTKELAAYDACRFDRLDAAVAALRTASTPAGSPAPSGTPKPSSSPTAPATVPRAARPGPSNTGVPAGTTLTPYTGPMTITTPGTVIDSKDVRGALVITAKDVVIRRSKIHDDPDADAGIYVQDTGSATITDSEIYDFQVGITYSNWTAIRVNLHDLTFDGMKISSNVRLQDSWVHDARPGPDAHWDGGQVQNGVTNTVIQGNYIDASGPTTNSALFLTPDLGPSTKGPLTVTGNWLEGGNFTVCILDGDNGRFTISDIEVTDNRFGRAGQYGWSNVNVPITQSGNVVDSTGAAYTL
jgi:hypothetical protein